jgi:phage terminase small subunit
MPQLEDPQAETYAQVYAATRNGPLALVKAGYPAGRKHDQLTRRVDISTRVQEIWQAQFEEANITPERVMRELERIAFQDIRPIFDTEGNLKPIHQLDDDVAATIASVDVEVRWEGKGDDAVPVTTKKVRRVDKMPALSILARHFKIVGDDNEGVNALASALADRLKAARQRAFGDRPQPDVEDAVVVTKPALPDDSGATIPKAPVPFRSRLATAASTPSATEESDDEQLW